MEYPDQEDGVSNLTSTDTTTPLLLGLSCAQAKSSISDELRNFHICLKWCALDHSSPFGKTISYLVFLIFTFLIPAATSLSFSSATVPGLITFNQLVQFPESCLAAIAFLTLAAFFRRHGLRQLLLLDNVLRHDSACVRSDYTSQLNRAFGYLAYILLPAFLVELVHKILFFATVSVRIPHIRTVAMAASLASWVYRSGVFLLVCVLFRLTCELQILRFERFYKMFELEVEGDGEMIFKEHMRIKKQLFLISHRYRIFIVGCLVTITISQLGALLLVLASKTEKNFCNSGDIMICSVVQLSGFLMCLFGAARITHRAQKVVSIASRWNMSLSTISDTKSNTATGEKQAPNHSESIAPNSNPSSNLPKSTILPPSSQWLSNFNNRHALVMYLQHNGGGITIFGFALDRGLLHTLFAFEMTLVLWILGKVVVVS